MTSPTVPWISADEVFRRVSFADGVAAYHRALRGDVDPATDLPKHIDDVHHGQVLLMPTQSSDYLGVKVVTVAPDNPARGLERIQGHYLMFDTPTLTPVAIMDGVALTTLRTPAVSAAAADLLAPARCEHLVVFGYGPQAWGHIEALRAIRDISRITLVARTHSKAHALAERVTASGIPTTVGAAEDVREAQLVVAATTAREPVVDGSLVPIDCCVIAVGSHEPTARELDTELMVRSQVVVEDRGHVMIEGGDVIIPIGEGAMSVDDVVPLRALVRGEVAVDTTRTRVFKSSGMPWEDLVIASEVLRRG